MAQPLSNPTEECTARSTDFFKQGGSRVKQVSGRMGGRHGSGWLIRVTEPRRPSYFFVQ